MAENPNNQPRPYDVVLGGNNPLAKVSPGATGKQSTQAQITSARVSTNLTGEQSSQSQGSLTQSSTVEKSLELETSTVGGGTLLSRWTVTLIYLTIAVIYMMISLGG